MQFLTSFLIFCQAALALSHDSTESSSSSTASSSAAASSTPGYSSSISSTVTNASFSFGNNYAVLNLDLINALVTLVNTTTEGQMWINNTATWINAVHAQQPPPLSIFTRIYFSNIWLPEIVLSDPFYAVLGSFGNVTVDSAEGMIYPAFETLAQDVQLRKSRYYAGDGNSLEEILATQKIDTVILVGPVSKWKSLDKTDVNTEWNSHQWSCPDYRISSYAIELQRVSLLGTALMRNH